jgi:CO/xanthine dehydrogenase FAD-binding subunit
MTHPKITTTSSIDEALSWLSEFGGTGGVILASGTDLFVEWRNGIPKPPHILNIGSIDSLNGIESQGETLWIGPMTTMATIAASSLIKESAPSLAQAAGAMGSPQIRQRATIGGNLCHASPAADTAAPLLALSAELESQSLRGQRQIPLKDFFIGPGTTVLGKDEILTGIRIPVVANRHDFYLRLSQRRALACVKVSVAGAAIINHGQLRQVRIALGAVAPSPLLARNTMSILEGSNITDSAIEQAAAIAMEECDPIDDIRSTRVYRRAMVGELLKEGLNFLLSGAQGS